VFCISYYTIHYCSPHISHLGKTPSDPNKNWEIEIYSTDRSNQINRQQPNLCYSCSKCSLPMIDMSNGSHIHVRFPVAKNKIQQTTNIKKETTQESTPCIYEQHSPCRKCFRFLNGLNNGESNTHNLMYQFQA
jgi:hypothetical protein